MAPKYPSDPLSGGDRKALSKELVKSRATATLAERSQEKTPCRRGAEPRSLQPRVPAEARCSGVGCKAAPVTKPLQCVSSAVSVHGSGTNAADDCCEINNRNEHSLTSLLSLPLGNPVALFQDSRSRLLLIAAVVQKPADDRDEIVMRQRVSWSKSVRTRAKASAQAGSGMKVRKWRGLQRLSQGYPDPVFVSPPLKLLSWGSPATPAS